MGERQSVWSNWGAENCQQFKKQKRQGRINKKLKGRKVKADGMRQKLPLEWSLIWKQVWLKWMRRRRWVRKEEGAVCGMLAFEHGRKNAAQETDALTCKWPPQGKKRCVALCFLDWKRKDNSSLNEGSMISMWGVGGRRKKKKKKQQQTSFSLFFQSLLLYFVPAVILWVQMISLSYPAIWLHPQAWKAESYHLHPGLMHWSELWVPSRFQQNWRLSWGQYKNISRAFSWHSPATWMTPDLCFCVCVFLSCPSREKIILKPPAIRVSISPSGLTVLWKSVNA